MSSMLRRSLPWLLLLAVLLGAGALLVRYTRWEEKRVPLPPQGEAETDRHYQLRHWLAKQGVTLQTPSELGTLPPVTDTLVLTSPLWDVRQSREQDLKRWVEAGGHLVLFPNTDEAMLKLNPLGIEETSEWQLQREQRKAEAKARAAASGHAAPPEKSDEDEDDEDDEEDTAPATPASGPALPRVPPPPKCDWTAKDAGAQPFFAELPIYQLCRSPSTVFKSRDLPAWGVRDELGWRALRLPLGRGELTLSAWYPNLDNPDLMKHDHAPLLAAMLKLRPGRQVWLMGSASLPTLPSWLWQQAAPVLLLALAALVLSLWRALPRFGPLRRPPPDRRRSLAEQVRGSASFLLQHRAEALHTAQCRALAEAARKLAPSASASSALPDPVTLALATGLSASALGKAIAPAQRNTRRLAQDLMLLETARRQLISLAAKGHTAPAPLQDSPQKASP
ncbi:DUF4350 domain-containing protein [Ideonella azotifigens]|nr:DUF4350 domain-containing protein [Ideonella azotifigens]MCD2343025.1 DUF4350 domain-containing protein [Ideonella azotifigens]